MTMWKFVHHLQAIILILNIFVVFLNIPERLQRRHEHFNTNILIYLLSQRQYERFSMVASNVNLSHKVPLKQRIFLMVNFAVICDLTTIWILENHCPSPVCGPMGVIRLDGVAKMQPQCFHLCRTLCGIWWSVSELGFLGKAGFRRIHLCERLRN